MTHPITPPSPELAAPWSNLMTDHKPNSITFNSPPTEEVLRLDKEGFHYRGQFIADAGEAHRLLLEFLKQGTNPEPQGPTDEEAVALYSEVMAVHECQTLGDMAGHFARAVLSRWGCQ
jgi:hypothetical protein